VTTDPATAFTQQERGGLGALRPTEEKHAVPESTTLALLSIPRAGNRVFQGHFDDLLNVSVASPR